MAQTPEGKVKNAVKKLLTDSQRWGSIYLFWPVQFGYGAATLDCLGCYRGRSFAIETKAPGQTMTKRQALVATEMLGAGMTVFLVDSADFEHPSMKQLERWLEHVRDGSI